MATRLSQLPVYLMLGACMTLGACGSGDSTTPAAEATTAPAAEVTTAPVEASAEAPAAHGDVHWGYEGEVAPANWGNLSPEYALCSTGTAQSPIEISGPSPMDVPNIVFSYQPGKVNIVNNGHTIQVNYDPGSYIELDGVRYNLVQFHFHAPAEHSVNGVLPAAELHLVHASDDGARAVVGVLLEAGAENPAFAPVWEHLPAVEGPVQTFDTMVNAADLLPASQATFRYDGSLTTPPCSEGIKWNVMTTPVQLSEAQLAAFTQIIQGNNRPLQPLNERPILEDSTP